MDVIRYLRIHEVLLIHQESLNRYGGTRGVRDQPAIQAALARPRLTVGGCEAFPTNYLKAAAYLDSFARNHPFIDGNKRVAFLSARQFLLKNEISLAVQQSEAYDFVMKVVTSGPAVDDIADWIALNCTATAL